jgi:hypothetical protein
MHNIKLDIPDITVVIEKGSEYLSTVTPSEVYQVLVNTGDNYNVVVDNHDIIVTNNSGSYLTVADYASTASYALIAQSLAAGGSIVYDTISASNAYFGNLTVSQSIRANLFTGSFVGNLVGTSSWASNAVSSSFALTASYVPGAVSTWDAITNKPTGLVSSSVQINTGSFSGSFTGRFIGTGSWANNSISASYAPVAVGTVSSSVQVNTGSFTGSFTGVLTGALVGTASWATSASYVLPSGLPSGVVSSSSQVSYTGLSNVPSGIVSSSGQVSYTGLSNIPTNIVSSSTQIVALGFATTGSNQFNGNQTITGSLIQGLGNTATGENSHAEGDSTQAIGLFSHAEGLGTIAYGGRSHAEGQDTIASGSYSHAEGYQTIALADHQHVQGQFNAVSSVPAAFIVGNGTDDSNRSNLIYAAGNEVQISGSLNVTNGITGSLYGTASRALTASFIDGGFY